MNVFILIFLSLIIGINTGLIFYLYKKNMDHKKVIDGLVQNILSQKTTLELSNKLTLDYLNRLERDISLLSSIPPNTTIN